MNGNAHTRWAAYLPLMVALLVTMLLIMTSCVVPTLPATPPPTQAPMEAASAEETPELSGTFTHMTWGGKYTTADTEAYLKPFAEEYGLEYQTVDAPAEFYARLKAMVEAGEVTVDTIDADALTAFQAWSEGLLEPLPEDLKADLVAACGEDMVTGFGVATGLFADIIACNTDAAEGCPTTPAEFWDVENFPGPRMMGTSTWYHNLMFALMADGVPPDELFPIGVDRAFAKLDEIKPDIAVWYTSGVQSQQVFRDEEVVMAYMWDGRGWGLQDQGLDMEYSYQGSAIGNTYYIVPKDAPNKEAAFAYLRWYATHPEAQSEWMGQIGYGTCNPEAYKLLEPEVAEKLVGAHFDEAAASDFGWIAEYGAEVKERWFTWLGE